jgi:hypothetical protein
MQPTFIPWLGYFNMISKSEIFVFLDDVQVSKRSWQTRNRIKNCNGEVFLNVPIRKGNSRNNINECEIAVDTKWVEEKIKIIDFSYKKAKHYKQNIGKIRNYLETDADNLSDFNSKVIEKICHDLQIKTLFVKSSELNSTGKKDEYLSSICKELGYNKYLSAQGSREYIETGVNYFKKNKISVEYNTYEHPKYAQGSKPFLSHMSVIDAVLNIGFEKTKELIT